MEDERNSGQISKMYTRDRDTAVAGVKTGSDSAFSDISSLVCENISKKTLVFFDTVVKENQIFNMLHMSEVIASAKKSARRGGGGGCREWEGNWKRRPKLTREHRETELN